MLKRIYSLFSLLLVFWASTGNSAAPVPTENDHRASSGTVKKMVVRRGSGVIDFDLDQLIGSRSNGEGETRKQWHFDLADNSYFTIRVFNDALRDIAAGSMALISQDPANFPEPLKSLANHLVIEKGSPSAPHDLVVRDEQTSFLFFTVEGHSYKYDAASRLLVIQGGRLRLSEELANKLGRPSRAGAIVGRISVVANMEAIEITEMVNGAARSTVLPPRGKNSFEDPKGGGVPGPDIIVGDLPSLAQVGASGTQVGLGVGTTSCNNGNVEVDWFELPDTDHCVIPQNLYRMSGGTSNSERFEQIGQSWMKHAFFALQDDFCGFGCVPASSGEHLGVGCSDPYEAELNSDQFGLGSRAWVNPFTGAFPSNAGDHTGHVHNGTSHRIVVETNDLSTTMNTGATYFAEAQYVTPHEYAWCQSHPGQCNMYNNASYRRFDVSGTTNFLFSPVGSTVRMTPAINAWTGATIQPIEPEPGVDGRAFLVWKVTQRSPTEYHYEYAIYNQNLDRGIQSFTLPLQGALATNFGFHAPPQHPGFPNDGTQGDAGFSSAPWVMDFPGTAIRWNCETSAANANANAIRWGTMYSFRFDSPQPPSVVDATIGFFKTGVDIAVTTVHPTSGPTPTPCGSACPPTPTPTPSSTPSPVPTASPTSTPGPAQAFNLSSRLRVEGGDNAGIGGLIITGTEPKYVLLRGIGPSLPVTDPLVDPTLDLRDSSGVEIFFNDNWRDTQEAEIIATGLAPTNNPEAAIAAMLQPGSYTVVLRGTDKIGGIGLVEIYDLDHSAQSRLANLSTRGMVGVNFEAMVAGFILGGTGSHRVVMRGIGPSLTIQGLSNVLADPTIKLFDHAGSLLVTNDNWQDDSVQAIILKSIGLAPPNQLESAIVTDLTANVDQGYTAVLVGSQNGTGVGLVEVYENPVGP